MPFLLKCQSAIFNYLSSTAQCHQLLNDSGAYVTTHTRFYWKNCVLRRPIWRPSCCIQQPTLYSSRKSIRKVNSQNRLMMVRVKIKSQQHLKQDENFCTTLTMVNSCKGSVFSRHKASYKSLSLGPAWKTNTKTKQPLSKKNTQDETNDYNQLAAVVKLYIWEE